MTCKRCSDGEATYCISCMNDIMTETDKALERAEARIVKLRACLFCKEPGCNASGTIYQIVSSVGDNELYEQIPCPTCGPLRAELCKTQREG